MNDFSGKTPVTVLVVDDNDLVRDLVGEILQTAQFNVMNAASGSEALDLMEQHRVDCVLLDYRLLDMKGSDVLAEMRKRNYDHRVVVMSAQPMGSGDFLSEKLDFDAYLRKPFMPDELVAVVKSILVSAD